MSRIEWLQRPGTVPATWNPIRARDRETGKVGWFCIHATDACRNCYAESMNAWRGNGAKYRAQDQGKVEIFLDEETLVEPLSWRKPRTCFPCSMTDLYAPFVKDVWLDKIKAIEALCPDHTFIELTKRPERMRGYNRGARLPDHGDQCFPLPNVWLGASCHDQASFDQVAPYVLGTPAAKRLLSIEPMLGPIDSNDPLLPLFDWILCGGESGVKARKMLPPWPIDLQRQCAAAGVAFHFKQWGAWAPVNVKFRPGGLPTATLGPDGPTWDMKKFGTKGGGRQLMGREFNEWPTT